MPIYHRDPSRRQREGMMVDVVVAAGGKIGNEVVIIWIISREHF